MPRFTLCAAIPLFDREPINPLSRSTVCARREEAAARASSGRRATACLAPAATSPTASLGLRNGTSIAAGVNDDGPRDARNRVRARR
jgi:hypothetical protein